MLRVTLSVDHRPVDGAIAARWMSAFVVAARAARAHPVVSAAEPVTLVVNGAGHEVACDPDTPLLYVLRNDLGLVGAKFGCGLGLCGACNVLVDGHPVHSCDTPVWAVAGKQVTTVEGLGAATGCRRLRRGAGAAVRLLHGRDGRHRRGPARARARRRRGRRPAGARRQPLPLRGAQPHRPGGARREAVRAMTNSPSLENNPRLDSWLTLDPAGRVARPVGQGRARPGRADRARPDRRRGARRRPGAGRDGGRVHRREPRRVLHRGQPVRAALRRRAAGGVRAGAGPAPRRGRRTARRPGRRPHGRRRRVLRARRPPHQLLGARRRRSTWTSPEATPQGRPPTTRSSGGRCRGWTCRTRSPAGPRFIHDLRPAGMLHGRVLRPPSRGAVLLLGRRHRGARQVPGVVAVVRDGSFLGVVAEREENALRALAALRAGSVWQEQDSLPDERELREFLVGAPTEETVLSDTAGAARPGGSVGARAVHPALPRPRLHRAVVRARASGTAAGCRSGRTRRASTSCGRRSAGCRGWRRRTSSSSTSRAPAATATTRPTTPPTTRCCWPARCPAGRSGCVWTPGGRAELGSARPGDGRRHRGRPGRGRAGAALAARRLEQRARPPPRAGRRAAARGHARRGCRAESRPASDPPLQNGGGSGRNAVPLYDLPGQLVRTHRLQTMPLRTSALRALGAHLNVYAIESVVDELAALAGVDPVEYRLRMLSDERARAVLEAAAERGRLGERRPRGRTSASASAWPATRTAAPGARSSPRSRRRRRCACAG